MVAETSSLPIGVFAGSMVGCALEQFVGTGLVSLEAISLFGDGSCIVADDGPGGVGAELVSACVVEFFDGPHEGDVSVAGDLEEIGGHAHVALGDADDKPQVALDEDGLDLFGPGYQSFDAFDDWERRFHGVEGIAQLCGPALEVVVLAKEGSFLVAGEDGQSGEVLDVGLGPVGGARGGRFVRSGRRGRLESCVQRRDRRIRGCTCRRGAFREFVGSAFRAGQP